jgi:phosphoglycerol transferase MdoB-like AlkP superfamily enzyme
VYSTNKTHGLVQILNEEGYETAFFHGGSNGTMDFDGFAGYVGFQHYFGRKEYNNDDDYDGFWGIYDEPFLQFVGQKLNTFKQPFFAFEFTLSSHYPYHLPQKHVSKFPEGELRIHRVVRYTDYALKKFFETVSQMSWYKNTLFIIVADHPAQSVMVTENENITNRGETISPELSAYYKNTSGRYAIPMMFFAPGDTNLRGIYSRTTQQTDLGPAILDYLNFSQNMVAFGQLVFDSNAPRVAVQHVSCLAQITSGSYSLLFDKEQAISLYNNLNDPNHLNNLVESQPSVADSLELQLKAILQQYTSRLVENKLGDTIQAE